ncbi:MAG: type VI secretion system baseplate subunit TssF [Candidatus Adiutrix sp.]|jgi:type VI secretion system protein ImpG|nr:type VI secretion system baseplate subunit TssF [Candidatus Adiutrix sp.]
MIDRYYQRELAKLRDLGAEFARLHPALAPLLTGQSSDPDVERILEGVAFLTGMMHQRLDNDFPEIIQGLFQLIYPHYLKPLPSTTMIHFRPRRGLMERLTVPAGTALSSVKLDGESCTFTTSAGLDLTPLNIGEVSFTARAGRRSLLSLEFESFGPGLDQLDLPSLRIYLAGEINSALQRYFYFFTRLAEIRVRPKTGGTVRILPKNSLRPVGFGEREGLLPYPERSFPGYRLLQEYFILPEKFLFLDIDLNGWTGRGSGSEFVLDFAFEDLAVEEIAMRKEHFLLHVAPAVNLFPQDADPILLDHRQSEYRVRVSGGDQRRTVHSVLSVHGLVHNTLETVEYLPFEMFNPQSQARPVYSLRYDPSPLDGATELTLTVAYPASQSARTETLSIKTMCTNGSLPESLRLGDVRVPTDSSPALADFVNISSPTAPSAPPLGHNLLWRLLSHLFLNYLSVANADNLRAMLKLYIFSNTRDKAQALANSKRVEAINDLKMEKCRRFLRGHLHLGRHIDLTLDPQGFSGPGDMYLFGSVLDSFLAGYAGVNSFTRLTVSDSLKQDRISWPEKLGDRFL